MPSFKKATPEQAYLKVGWYGSQGSGKTLTNLMVGEWLLEQENKKQKPKTPFRMAYIDTERGTDFYTREVKERKIHPAAFDFDRIVTRSVYEAKDALADLRKDPGPYKVVVIDSMTHLWEAAKESYSGKRTTDGGVPITGWGSIKKPIKAIGEAGLNGEFHYMFAGREGLVFEKNEDSGEDEVTGYKMKADTEAAYEPHVLIQMYQFRTMKAGQEQFEIRAFFEKDRSGCLTGQTIKWPKADLLAPLYALLAGNQGTFTTADEASALDAKMAHEEKENKNANIDKEYTRIRSLIQKAENKEELKKAWGETKGKKMFLGHDRFDALSALTDGRLAELNQNAVTAEKEG